VTDFFSNSTISSELAALYASNLRKVQIHVDSECGNDADVIMTTVEDDPRFAILWPADANEALQIDARTDTPSVHDHYASMRETIEVVKSVQVRRIVSDWFVFHESVATMRDVADKNGGIEFEVNTAVIFPVGPMGIIGEFPVNRTSFAKAVRSTGKANEVCTSAVSLLDQHEQFVSSWTKADVNGIIDQLAPGSVWATRRYGAGDGPLVVAHGLGEIAAALRDELTDWRATSATVINRVVTEWYVFAEIVWQFEGERGETLIARTATTSPVRSGQLAGAVGYGTSLLPDSQ
jgi:hypothetical protein